VPKEAHLRVFAFPAVLRLFVSPVLLFVVPTYLYEILDKKGAPTGETFEIVQSMKDDTLTTQPGTNKPCRRAVVAPNIAGKWSDIKGKSQLSNANLERMGFTKYERKGKGYMERVAGKQGPKSISAED
jgi:predicted nucleic acid-binding Zn ribbon protein